MIFVCLSHFMSVYGARAGATSGMPTDLVRLSFIATPAFMLISGMMMGYVYAGGEERFDGFRRKLIDRGLFLLVPGHLLIVVAHLHASGTLVGGLRWLFITDVIGISIILGPLLVGRLSALGRLALAIGLFVVSWGILHVWQPTGFAGNLVRETLLGPGERTVYLFSFPVVPWFAVYFGASALGEWLAQRRRQGGDRAMVSTLERWGLIGLALAAGLHGVNDAARFALGSRWTHEMLASFTQKLPPSPAYILFYGGAALLLVAGLMILEQRGPASRLVASLAVVGRTSLFVFILQYYVYFDALQFLPIKGSLAWAGAFVLSLAVIGVASRLWLGAGLNRLITVGYPAADRWLRERRLAHP